MTPLQDPSANSSTAPPSYLLCCQVALYRASGSGLGEDESGRVGRLSFVDLAGSERANRTGNVGARLKYALHCMHHCLATGAEV